MHSSSSSTKVHHGSACSAASVSTLTVSRPSASASSKVSETRKACQKRKSTSRTAKNGSSASSNPSLSLSTSSSSSSSSSSTTTPTSNSPIIGWVASAGSCTPYLIANHWASDSASEQSHEARMHGFLEDFDSHWTSATMYTEQHSQHTIALDPGPRYPLSNGTSRQ
ncbi:hypothetical protein B7463_g1928, partial [Scytalidium lignicola]